MKKAMIYGAMLILFMSLLMVPACGGGGKTTTNNPPPVNTATNTPGVVTTTASTIPGTPVATGVGAGKASALTFLTQPAGAKAGVPFKVQPVVAIVDGYGTVVTNYVGNTSIRIASGDGELSGSATVIFIKGIATFTDLALDKPGTYVLKAVTREVQSASSEPLVVEP